MKKVQLHQKTSEVIDELTAQYLENICKLFGHNITINDTDWQTVYDLKEKVLNKVEELGLKINNNLF